DGEVMMRLAPAEKIVPLAACSIAVISTGENFGDRLGRQMIDAMLPGEADVHHLAIDNLREARAGYDLVIVGTGNGLAAHHLSEELDDVVARGRAAVGIFGTQYRQTIPRARLARLIGRLDCWFARNE